MAYLPACVVLVLVCFIVTPCWTQEIIVPKYTTVGTCDEVCRLHPEAKCKLDCVDVDPKGVYSDCINHFYYSNGNIEYHCDWD